MNQNSITYFRLIYDLLKYNSFVSGQQLSPDGKFLWTGTEWIPAPPKQEILPQQSFYTPSYSPQSEVITPSYSNQSYNNQNEFYNNDLMMINDNGSKKLTIAISILVALIISFAVVAIIILLNEELVEEDDVVLAYIYTHTCDEVVATYSDENGEAIQEFDYYEGDIVIQFSGKMSEGDDMFGGMIVSNFDDDYCFITVVYTVQINGGDVITLAKDGPQYCEQYDDVSVFYDYIHE